ncbi:MAG: lysophospholipid acyltransferase family protein [Myxococcota bacterium]
MTARPSPQDRHRPAPDRSPALEALIAAPAAWLADKVADPVVAARAEQAVLGAAAQFGGAAVPAALQRLATAGTAGGLAPADPVLRALMRAWMGAIASTRVHGVHHLGLVGRAPVVAVSNHLSFADTTATECALLRAGGAARAFADRMWALAGPKVWDEPLHALASSGLNLVPTAQSRHVGASSDAQAVLQGLVLARERVRAGDPLLVYAEGTRSRTGRLGPFLAGVRHHLAVEGTVVLPIALVGVDRLYPVDAQALVAGRIDVTIGAPIPVDDPLDALARAHEALAALLPERHRPAPGTPPIV